MSRSSFRLVEKAAKAAGDAWEYGPSSSEHIAMSGRQTHDNLSLRKTLMDFVAHITSESPDYSYADSFEAYEWEPVAGCPEIEVKN